MILPVKLLESGEGCTNDVYIICTTLNSDYFACKRSKYRCEKREKLGFLQVT